MKTNNNEEPTLEQILGWLPEKISLIFVDRNESLDEDLKLLQDCIHQNSWNMISEHIESWYLEQIQTSVLSYQKDLKKTIISYYGLTAERATELIDEYETFIDDAIYERCNDTTVNDLLRNTRVESVYYDTGYEVPADSWNWTEKQLNKEIKSIMKVLNIKELSERRTQIMTDLIQQASYGGQLVIYFQPTWNDLISQEETTSIKFSNFHLGIIHTGNGSGDAQYFGDLEIELPFERKNLFIDKLDKYSFVYEVCGMVHNWCCQTKFEFGNKFKTTKKPISKTSEQRNIQEEYQKTYESGKCTVGDMNITRHRNVTYINDYPCGNRCHDCGTFWID